MSNVGPLVITVFGSIVALAMIAVIVSKNAQTPQVLSSAGSALADIIGKAVSPVAGSSTNQFGAANN